MWSKQYLAVYVHIAFYNVQIMQLRGAVFWDKRGTVQGNELPFILQLVTVTNTQLQNQYFLVILKEKEDANFVKQHGQWMLSC